MNQIILEGDSEGFLDKAVKMGYSAVKTKIVAMLTGTEVLSHIGTVLDLLSFLPGVDRKIVDDKLKSMTKMLQGGIENMDEFLKKIPFLETLFGDEKECLKNVLRFAVFASQISLGSYPAENYNLAKVVAVQSTFIALVALWIAFGAGCVGSGGIAATVAWVVKDLSVMCFNAVFPLVEEDLKKFEEWAKQQDMDLDKTKQALEKGNVEAAKGQAPKQDNQKQQAQKQGQAQQGQTQQKQAAESTIGKQRGNQMKKKNLQQVDEGFGKLIGTAAKGLWKAVKPALKEVAKDVAKDIAKDAARAGIQMAKDGLGKLNNALIGKIQKVSPTTAEIIQKTGMMFLDYCAKNNLTEDSLTQYADKFIDKSLNGAEEGDKAVLQDMKAELDNTQDLEAKIAKIGSMIAVAKQTAGEGQQEMKMAAEATLKIRWIRL